MLELPYPPKALNPNQRVHFHEKGRVARKYRRDCGWLAKGHAPIKTFTVTFHPPDNRDRDVDNVIAACKAMIDGLADVWTKDKNDKHFNISWPEKMAEPIKHGKVVIS